jgi:hypothetical protein
MQFSAFRRRLLGLFSDTLASKIEFDDVSTQATLPDSGRPDIQIETLTACIIIEVKLDQTLGLTKYQPEGYFSHLAQKSKKEGKEGWLVFLVPKGWACEADLKSRLVALKEDYPAIRTEVVYWEKVLDIIEEGGLEHLNPFFDHFQQLLVGWFRPKSIVFSLKEVEMLYSKELPLALYKTKDLIDQILKKSKYAKPFSGKGLPSEYGIYFQNTEGNNILWFGVWPEFWKEKGVPLCFGVDKAWGTESTFRAAFKGDPLSFQNGKWILGCVPKDAFLSERAVDEIWAQLEPILEKVSVASGGGEGAP